MILRIGTAPLFAFRRSFPDRSVWCAFSIWKTRCAWPDWQCGSVFSGALGFRDGI